MSQGNYVKIMNPIVVTLIKQCNFYNRVINNYNELSNDVVQADSINGSKNKLEKQCMVIKSIQICMHFDLLCHFFIDYIVSLI